MFQIPIGPWPFKEGKKVISENRPWWGVGVVESKGGKFAIRWADGLVWHYDERVIDHMELEEYHG